MDIKKLKDSELDDKLQSITDSWEFDGDTMPDLCMNDLMDVIAEKASRSKGKKEIK